MAAYVGEIRMFAGNFAPLGWALCQGQTLPISENEVLFQLIGTTYGGDGQETFQLPNLQGRIPIHQGSGYVIGQLAGSETVGLTVNQIPSHTHPPLCQSAMGNQAGPGGGVWASSNLNQYSSNAPSVNMDPGALSPVGNSVAHDNMMPFLAINFIISLYGVFPSQT